MATEQDILDATYIKKTNQIKLAIKKALSLQADKDNKNLVKSELFFKMFLDNKVSLDPKAK